MTIYNSLHKYPGDRKANRSEQQHEKQQMPLIGFEEWTQSYLWHTKYEGKNKFYKSSPYIIRQDGGVTS